VKESSETVVGIYIEHQADAIIQNIDRKSTYPRLMALMSSGIELFNDGAVAEQASANWSLSEYLNEEVNTTRFYDCNYMPH